MLESLISANIQYYQYSKMLPLKLLFMRELPGHPLVYPLDLAAIRKSIRGNWQNPDWKAGKRLVGCQDEALQSKWCSAIAPQLVTRECPMGQKNKGPLRSSAGLRTAGFRPAKALCNLGYTMCKILSEGRSSRVGVHTCPAKRTRC